MVRSLLDWDTTRVLLTGNFSIVSDLGGGFEGNKESPFVALFLLPNPV